MEYMKFRDKSLTIGERIDDLLGRLTVDEKINMLSSVQREVPRLGVGKWTIGCEAARGFVSKDPNEVSTVFPQPIGMASTFDKELMRKIGEIAGDETRHYYKQDPTGRLMLWGPLLIWNAIPYGEELRKPTEKTLALQVRCQRNTPSVLQVLLTVKSLPTRISGTAAQTKAEFC